MSPERRPAGHEASVASPCTSVCTIDQASGWCAGCFRTLAEIAGWVGYSEAQKRVVIEALPARRERIER